MLRLQQQLGTSIFSRPYFSISMVNPTWITTAGAKSWRAHR